MRLYKTSLKDRRSNNAGPISCFLGLISGLCFFLVKLKLGNREGREVARLKDKRLVKQEARNDAKKKRKKREVGQRSEGRNVTAICDM